MRVRLCIATPIALVLVLAACGQGTAPTVKPATPKPTTTTASSPTTAPGIPMVRETGSPARPPTVTVALRSDARAVHRRGSVYVADFVNRHAVTEVYTKFPIPWPATASVDRTSVPQIEFDTAFAPDSVQVVSYAHVQPTSLVPLRGLSHITCQRFRAPRCRFVKTAAGVRLLGLPRTVFTAGYVSVFASWHVPMSERRADNKSMSINSACWLFRFDPEPGVGASQP